MTTTPPGSGLPPPHMDYPPVEGPVPEKRGWVKWVVLGCAVLVLAIGALVAAIIFGVMKATEGPELVAREFLAATAEGDAARAYETFSAPLRDVQSLEELTAMIEENPSLFATTDASFNSRSVDTSSASLSGTVTLESGTELPVSFRLVQENDEWKLIAWNLGETSQ